MLDTNQGQLCRVTTGYFCCGLYVRAGVIVHAAPIMRWSIGKTAAFVQASGLGETKTRHVLNSSESFYPDTPSIHCMRTLLAYLFGCMHDNTTWPRREKGGNTYLRCTDCGDTIPFNEETWQRTRKPTFQFNRVTTHTRSNEYVRR